MTGIGANVTNLKPGDRVVAMAPGHFATHERLPQWAVCKLQDNEEYTVNQTPSPHQVGTYASYRPRRPSQLPFQQRYMLSSTGLICNLARFASNSPCLEDGGLNADSATVCSDPFRGWRCRYSSYPTCEADGCKGIVLMITIQYLNVRSLAVDLRDSWQRV